MDFELTAEQKALRRRARALADGAFAERAAHWDESEEYPWDNVKALAGAGFMGMTVPREFGGAARPLLDVILVIEEMGARVRRYFPWVLEGEKPAIAITEVDAGSAATDPVTRADETATGFRLTGHKRYITGAGTSRLYLVYARFGARAGAPGIGGVLVERDTPGLRIGRCEFMMGLAAFRRASCTSRAARSRART